MFTVLSSAIEPKEADKYANNAKKHTQQFYNRFFVWHIMRNVQIPRKVRM